MSGRRLTMSPGSTGRQWPMCARTGCWGSESKVESRMSKVKKRYLIVAFSRVGARLLTFDLRLSTLDLQRQGRPRDEPSGGTESAFGFVSAVCAVGVWLRDCGRAHEQHCTDGVLSDAVARRDIGTVLFGGRRVCRR